MVAASDLQDLLSVWLNRQKGALLSLQWTPICSVKEPRRCQGWNQHSACCEEVPEEPWQVSVTWPLISFPHLKTRPWGLPLAEKLL